MSESPTKLKLCLSPLSSSSSSCGRSSGSDCTCKKDWPDKNDPCFGKIDYLNAHIDPSSYLMFNNKIWGPFKISTFPLSTPDSEPSFCAQEENENFNNYRKIRQHLMSDMMAINRATNPELMLINMGLGQSENRHEGLESYLKCAESFALEGYGSSVEFAKDSVFTSNSTGEQEHSTEFSNALDHSATAETDDHSENHIIEEHLPILEHYQQQAYIPQPPPIFHQFSTVYGLHQPFPSSFQYYRSDLQSPLQVIQYQLDIMDILFNSYSQYHTVYSFERYVSHQTYYHSNNYPNINELYSQSYQATYQTYQSSYLQENSGIVPPNQLNTQNSMDFQMNGSECQNAETESELSTSGEFTTI